MTSTVLITGGTGLFGSTLIEQYLREEPDTDIIALVRGPDTQSVTDCLRRQIQNSPTFPSNLYPELTRRLLAIPGDFTQSIRSVERETGSFRERHKGAAGTIVLF